MRPLRLSFWEVFFSQSSTSSSEFVCIIKFISQLELPVFRLRRSFSWYSVFGSNEMPILLIPYGIFLKLLNDIRQFGHFEKNKLQVNFTAMFFYKKSWEWSFVEPTWLHEFIIHYQTQIGDLVLIFASLVFPLSIPRLFSTPWRQESDVVDKWW